MDQKQIENLKTAAGLVIVAAILIPAVLLSQPSVDINNLTEIDGDLAYKAGDKIIWGDTEIKKKGIMYPVDINDSLAYIVKGEEADKIVIDGEQYGGSYNNISYLAEVNDKPAFIAQHNLPTNFVSMTESNVIYGGTEFGHKLENVYSPIPAEDQVAFIGEKEDGTYIGIGSSSVKTNYTAELDQNKLAYVNQSFAYVGTDGNRSFIVYDGNKISEDYKEINFLSSYGQKLAYKGVKEDEKHLVYGEDVYRGEIGEVKFTDQGVLYVKNSGIDLPAFPKRQSIYLNDREISDSYQEITSIEPIGNKVYFSATKPSIGEYRIYDTDFE